MGKRIVDYKQHIINNVIIVNTTQCWNWQLHKMYKGYGTIWYRPKQTMVFTHRLSYELFNNIELDKDIFVLHECDNRACCNPDHLFLGNHDINMADMVSKGRQNSKSVGSHNNNAILTEEQVLEIRKLYESGKYTQLILSKMYDVALLNISRIIRRKLWKHI